MKFGNESRVFDRGAPADLWRHTLSQIPTLFGRLVYLCALRNSDTGRYEHHGLAQYFGDDESHRALERSHEETFRGWLDYSLEQQKADLDLYLAALTSDRAAIVDNWLQLAPYRNLAPARTRDSERTLFRADFEALLVILTHEYSVTLHDREDI